MNQQPSQPSLLSSGSAIPLRQKPTLTGTLAAYFRAREGEWIDGMELARVAGSYAWRSRCSDLRRAPYLMRIENRVRLVRDPLGRMHDRKVSEYRWVKE